MELRNEYNILYEIIVGFYKFLKQALSSLKKIFLTIQPIIPLAIITINKKWFLALNASSNSTASFLSY